MKRLFLEAIRRLNSSVIHLKQGNKKYFRFVFW